MGYINVNEELLEHVGSMDNVKAVQLKLEQRTTHSKSVQLFHLPEGYREGQLNNFLQDIDITYDNGYGWQRTIWFLFGGKTVRGQVDTNTTEKNGGYITKCLATH